MAGWTVWFGVGVWGVDVRVAVDQADEVVGDAVLDEVMAGMHVSGLPRDTNGDCKLEGWEVIDIDRGRTGLGEADSSKVIPKTE